MEHVASKIERLGNFFQVSVNLFPSMPSVATGGSFSTFKQSSITKLDHLFWNSIDALTHLAFYKVDNLNSVTIPLQNDHWMNELGLSVRVFSFINNCGHSDKK